MNKSGKLEHRENFFKSWAKPSKKSHLKMLWDGSFIAGMLLFETH